MKKVLIINSSARSLHSQSRKLTEVFTENWKSIHHNPVINFRELGNADVPHINENWIAAAFKPEAARSAQEIEALKISDVYIAELKQADVIVIGSPMYNWSVPSSLKAYIDQILRINETWKLNPANQQNPYIGLLQDKTLLLLLSSGNGGYEQGAYNAHMNFQSTYLKTVFKVTGIDNIQVVSIEGASFDPVQYKLSVEQAHQKVKELVLKIS